MLFTSRPENKKSELAKDTKFSAHSKSKVYRQTKMPIGICKPDRRHSNRDHPSLLGERDKQKMVRAILFLRKTRENVIVARLKLESGIDRDIPHSTVTLCVNRVG